MSQLTLDQFRAVVREEVARAPATTDRILTTAEAIAYTKHGSYSAFARWCTRWRVTSGTSGRYARGHLDSALDRETRRRRQPKSPPSPGAKRRDEPRHSGAAATAGAAESHP